MKLLRHNTEMILTFWNSICCCLPALSLSHSISKFVSFVFSIFPSLFSVHSNFYYWSIFAVHIVYFTVPNIKLVYSVFFFMGRLMFIVIQ